ncbi:MAG: hypothetical protein NC131_06140 [Roseburia sp.]|nr:hypothetical protein [Roseburia sp.]
MQTNIQILEAILNRKLQSEQTEEINSLKPLNSFNGKDSDRIFFLDTDETPALIGYASPEMDPETIQETIKDSTLIWDAFKIKIYQLN